MALYFYKGYDGDLQYFIKCEWVNDVDYTVDQDPELPICNLTLTTLKEFWLGTVTRKELQSFLKKGREPDKLTEVVTVALQGDTKYQDNDLKWRLKADGEGGGECEVALHVYLDGKLPLILGKFHIPKLDNSKRDEYLKIWMEAVVVQNAKSKEIRRAVLERNQDLVELKSTLEKRLDDIVSEKVDAEINLLLKMKKLINSKKRRIRLLLTERQRAEEEAKEAEEEAAAAKDVKGKQSTAKKDKGKTRADAASKSTAGKAAQTSTGRGRKRKLDDTTQADSQQQQTQPETQTPSKRVRFKGQDSANAKVEPAAVTNSQSAVEDIPNEEEEQKAPEITTSSAPPAVVDLVVDDKQGEEEEDEDSDDPEREMLERVRKGRIAFAKIREITNPRKQEPKRRTKPKEHEEDTTEEEDDDSDATV